jgi:hypothetical protein
MEGTLMEYVTTVKRFVAGSYKFFEIYKCTVSEVENYTSPTDKQMTRIKVGNEEYSGLYNKVVYEMLCANEGSESFIVLWKAPKGKPMLAYVKSIWEEYAAGKLVDAPAIDNSKVVEGESFVYLWINKDTQMKYIGKHKGLTDDGYICSSESFLAEYNEAPSRFFRTILAYGSDQEMLELETMLLLQLKTRMSPLYYNLSNNLTGGKFE